MKDCMDCGHCDACQFTEKMSRRSIPDVAIDWKNKKHFDQMWHLIIDGGNSTSESKEHFRIALESVERQTARRCAEIAADDSWIEDNIKKEFSL